MTSVLLRVLGTTTVRPGNEYVPNLPAESAQVGVDGIATSVADRPPELVTVDVRAMGGAPRMITGEPMETRTESAMQPEPAVPGSGNRACPQRAAAGRRSGQARNHGRSGTRTTRRSRRQARHSPDRLPDAHRLRPDRTQMFVDVSPPKPQNRQQSEFGRERGGVRSNSPGRDESALVGEDHGLGLGRARCLGGVAPRSLTGRGEEPVTMRVQDVLSENSVR